MRAVRLDEGATQERVMRACLEEIESWRGEGGASSGGVLVIHVREFVESQIENGAEPQRKAQPR